MIPQVIGTKNNQETRKAERYLKERGIKYRFVDLSERGLSKGEIEGIARFVPLSDLLDTDGKEYEKRGFEHMEFDIKEELSAEPKLIRQPILRHDRGAVVGFDPLKWKDI